MHVVRSIDGHVFIDEIDLVRPLYAIRTATLISSAHRTLGTYVPGTATVSPSWITFMCGMAVAQSHQNALRRFGVHRIWPPGGRP